MIFFVSLTIFRRFCLQVNIQPDISRFCRLLRLRETSSRSIALLQSRFLVENWFVRLSKWKFSVSRHFLGFLIRSHIHENRPNIYGFFFCKLIGYAKNLTIKIHKFSDGFVQLNCRNYSIARTFFLLLRIRLIQFPLHYYSLLLPLFCNFHSAFKVFLSMLAAAVAADLFFIYRQLK